MNPGKPAGALGPLSYLLCRQVGPASHPRTHYGRLLLSWRWRVKADSFFIWRMIRSASIPLPPGCRASPHAQVARAIAPCTVPTRS